MRHQGIFKVYGVESGLQEHLQRLAVRIGRVPYETVEGVSQTGLTEHFKCRPCHPSIHIENLSLSVRRYSNLECVPHLRKVKFQQSTFMAFILQHLVSHAIEDMGHIPEMSSRENRIQLLALPLVLPSDCGEHAWAK